MHKDRLAGLQPGIVEQHVLDRAEGDGRDGRGDRVDARRGRDQQPRRQVDLLLREAVEMEAMHAADIFTKIVAALPAGPAQAAGARAVDRDQLARRKAGHARTDRLDLAGGLRADSQRQLAFGEGHAAPAPHIDVVERNRLDPKRDFAERRRWRRRDVDRSSLRSSISCNARIRLALRAQAGSGDRSVVQRRAQSLEPFSKGRSLPLRPVPSP